MKFHCYTLRINRENWFFFDEKINKYDLVASFFKRKIDINLRSHYEYIPIRTEGNYIYWQYGKEKSQKIWVNTWKEIIDEIVPDWDHIKVITFLWKEKRFKSALLIEFKQGFNNEKFILNMQSRINQELRLKWYILSIDPLPNENSFEEILQKYDKHIKEITVTLRWPNFLSNDPVEEVMENLESLGVDQFTWSYKSDEWNISAEIANETQLNQYITYASSGGWNYSVYTDNWLKFNKQSNIKQVSPNWWSLEIDRDMSHEEFMTLIQLLLIQANND
jgi:hypothetical protein